MNKLTTSSHVWGGVRQKIKADISMNYGGGLKFIKFLFFPNPASFVFWFRIFAFIVQTDRTRIFSTIVKQIYKVHQLIMGYDIPLTTNIGKGLLLMHYPEIVINGDCIIGDYVTIFNGVTLGMKFSGEKKGCPQIGNHVKIYPGARVIGNIKVGNHVVIGANSVVVDDVPDYSVVAGVPAKILKSLDKELV